jgi:hypothetical protein
LADEAKLRSQVDRGETARVVLRELEGAHKALEQQCFETFRSSEIHDDEGRKACRLYLKVLDDVVSRFAYFVTTGEEAHKELIRLRDPNVIDKMRKLVPL